MKKVKAEKEVKLNGKHFVEFDVSAAIANGRASSETYRRLDDEMNRATAISRQLIALRKKRGLSQKDLARLLGTSQAAVSRMENPEYHGHSLQLILRAAKALGRGVRITFPPLEDAR